MFPVNNASQNSLKRVLTHFFKLFLIGKILNNPVNRKRLFYTKILNEIECKCERLKFISFKIS